MILNILFTLLLVFLNGFFVAAEFSIVKVRASQIELRIRSGSKLAKIARGLTENLDAYLAATQLGITLSSLGLGWIGESVVAQIILDLMNFFGIAITFELAHKIALPTAFITITALHIILGELAPKSLAIQRPEAVSLSVAIPLRIFYIIFKPFIWFLNTIANLILKAIGFEPISEEQELHSSEELRYLLEESSKSGIIDTTEHKLLENVFEFSDTPVKQVMVPHNRIIAIDINMTFDKIVETFINEGYSRIPVYERTHDNIIGMLYAKDLLSMMNNKELIIHDKIRPPFFIYEEEKISFLLRKLQKEKIHFAIVVDEFGGTAGIVTLEDILEELVGEIQDEYDEETPLVEKLSDSEYIIKASAAIDDANDYLPFKLQESDDYETVGGLIMNAVGRIPEENEIIDLDNYECQIIKRADRNLELIRLTIKPENGSENSG